jgi:hypothetical protein
MLSAIGLEPMKTRATESLGSTMDSDRALGNAAVLVTASEGVATDSENER